MKVLHVIPSLSPALGGPTQVALNLVKALRDAGTDAEIVTTNDNGAELLDVPLDQRIDYEQVPVWFLPRFSPPLKEFIFSPAITRWLWQHIREYDILDNHYLFSYAPTCAGAIARWQNIPYTVRTMGQLSPWALAQSQLKKQAYTTLIERHNLQQAAAIHCTAQAEAEDVRRFGIKTPTITLPLGVPTPSPCSEAKLFLRQRYNIAPDCPIVLFLSRLHYKKRPEVLIKAAHQLNQHGRRLHLVLAGTGTPEYISELQQLIHDLDLTAHVSLIGFVTGAEKDLVLQGSDLFVLPSFSENFGIAVAEALAVGLPVIVTPDIHIAAEIAAAQAGLVAPGEVDAIATAITQLIDSPPLRHQLGKNGIHLAQTRYSWQAIAQSLTAAYAAILEQGQILQRSANI